MILITGSTGQLGAAVVEQLIHKSAIGQFAVFARDPQKAQKYVEQGIPLRIGDFDSTDTLSQAFQGIHTLLLISSRSMDRAHQQKKVVDVAVAAGVRHIVYTGLAIQDIATSHVQAVMQSHFDTEEHIRSTGVAFTFLRNTMYAEALPEIVGAQWRQQGILLPGGQGKVPYALRREMGEAAANVLLQKGHEMQTYDITGSQGFSYQDIAQALSALHGITVPYQDMDPSAFKQQLRALGLPDFLVYLTVGTVLDVRDHQYEVQSNALRTLLGREPAGLHAMLKEVMA